MGIAEKACELAEMEKAFGGDTVDLKGVRSAIAQFRKSERLTDAQRIVLEETVERATGEYTQLLGQNPRYLLEAVDANETYFIHFSETPDRINPERALILSMLYLKMEQEIESGRLEAERIPGYLRKTSGDLTRDAMNYAGFFFSSIADGGEMQQFEDIQRTFTKFRERYKGFDALITDKTMDVLRGAHRIQSSAADTYRMLPK